MTQANLVTAFRHLCLEVKPQDENIRFQIRSTQILGRHSGGSHCILNRLLSFLILFPQFSQKSSEVYQEFVRPFAEPGINSVIQAPVRSAKQKNNPDIIFNICNCEKEITSKFLTPKNKRQDKQEIFDEILKL